MVYGPSLKVGQMVGPYRIIRGIGAGGMGEVYQAEDPTLGRSVALKILLPTLMSDENFIKRFLAEGKSLAKINHRNVVTVYSLGVHDGIYYMAMELIDGQTLDEIILKGPLSYKQIYSYLRQILSGVAALHENKILHRDLKPKNMIVNTHNVLKIVDFGIAKMKIEDLELTTLTPGTVIGSLSYIAPEVLSGGAATEQSDLWSVGVLLYEMLYGEKLFAGTTSFGVMDAVRSKVIKPPFGRRLAAPQFLTDVMYKLLDRSVATRAASAKAILAEFKTSNEQLLEKTPSPQPVLSADTIKFETDKAPVKPRNDEVSSEITLVKRIWSATSAVTAFGLAAVCAIGVIAFNKIKKDKGPETTPSISATENVPHREVAHNPTTPATLTDPANGAQIDLKLNEPLRFSWNAGSQTNVRLQISEESNFNHLKFDFDHARSPLFFPDLPRGRAYYWRLASSSGLPLTESRDFTLIGPQNPVITIAPAPPAPTATTELASPKKTVVSRHVSPKPKTHISLRESHPAAAVRPVEREPASVPQAIPKIDVSPPKPSLPQEGIDIVATDSQPVPVVFRWEVSPGADAYQLELSSTKNFSKIIVSKKTHDTQFVLKTALPTGNIYWRLRAKKEHTISAWSEPSSFEVTKP